MNNSTFCARWGWLPLAAALTVLSIAIAPAPARAQGGLLAQGGYEFYVAFPDTVMNLNDPRFPDRRWTDDEAWIFIYSATATKVNIEGLSYKKAGMLIPAGKFTTVNLLDRTSKAPATI